MNVLTHVNEDEYSAQRIVSTTKHYRGEDAEVANMKASAGNKPAVVRGRFHEGQSSRPARLSFMEAKRKHDSQCESCGLDPATPDGSNRTAWVAGIKSASAYYSSASVTPLILNKEVVQCAFQLKLNKSNHLVGTPPNAFGALCPP